MGIKGDLGIPGDPGPVGSRGEPGMKGDKGDPGQSISVPYLVQGPVGMTVNESQTAIFFLYFIYLFILFYRYKTRTYRSIRRNITKFTTNTLITNYKEKKTTLHYTTLQGFHNLFNLNLKKSNLGNLRKTKFG